MSNKKITDITTLAKAAEAGLRFKARKLKDGKPVSTKIYTQDNFDPKHIAHIDYWESDDLTATYEVAFIKNPLIIEDVAVCCRKEEPHTTLYSFAFPNISIPEQFEGKKFKMVLTEIVEGE